MKIKWDFVPGLPQLDIHTLSEDWMLAAGLEVHWNILAQSLGKLPSQWIDAQGSRMYAAVIWLQTDFDLEDTIKEDEHVSVETSFISVRKPHALSLSTFHASGKEKARLKILTAS